jgi:hypothetical protein
MAHVAAAPKYAAAWAASLHGPRLEGPRPHVEPNGVREFDGENIP